MNALDVAVERRFSGGLTFQAGYTLAKNMTDVGNSSEKDVIEDPYDRRRDWANVSNMPTHRFVGELLYEIPFGKGKRYGADMNAIATGILGNWQISAVCILQSGPFLNVTYDGDSPNTRSGGGRPDLVGNWKPVDQNRYLWFAIRRRSKFQRRATTEMLTATSLLGPGSPTSIWASISTST